ncbi:MAG TPA: multiheme c-type cytochrome, partial [Lacipirellulaceae bacterium]|nr:multiheme c-type cytochrome [Lacipirellulaceae bacterium]
RAAGVLAGPAHDELIGEHEDLLFSSPAIRDRRAADSPAGDSPPPPQDLPADAESDELIDEDGDLLEPPVPAVPPARDPLETLPSPSVDDLLDDRDDLLDAATPPEPSRRPPPSPPPAAPAAPPAAGPAPASPATSPGPADAQSQCEFVAQSLYPSALECRACHEKIYDEWSVSSHAYAFVSPMFHKFEQTINNITSGTIGYFCYRCHTPAGTSLGISRDTPLWELPQVAREGVTCVSCHRVREMYGKTNGERRIEPGDVFAPVYGS